MKIAALTDIHGAYDRALKILRKETPDAAIIGGDLTTVGSVKEAEDALQEMMKIVPKIFCVAGNMDLPQHDLLFDRMGVSLNGHGRVESEIGFFGVSAAPRSPLKTPYEISEEEILRKITEGYREVRSAHRKILVPHAPPYGTKVDIAHSGLHVGSISVREAIEELQPDLTICGHIHEARGQDILGKTRIVNCGPAMKGYYATISFTGGLNVENKTD